MSAAWQLVSFGELARLERRPVEVVADREYKEIGTYSYGRGIFHKQPRSGLEVGNKDLFLIKEGDLILQVTFAWEGAIALCSKAEDGLYGSVRYPTFRVNEDRCFAPFLQKYLCTRQGLDQIDRICPGSAGRNRVLAIKRLPEIMIPLPPLKEQRRIVSRIDEIGAKISEARALRDAASLELAATFGAMVKRIEEQYADYASTLQSVVVSYKNGLSRRPSGEESGPIVLRLADVSSGQISLIAPRRGSLSALERDAYSLHEGDVLVVRVNGSKSIVGRFVPVGQHDDELCFNDHLIRIRLDTSKVVPEFLVAIARGPRVRQHMETSAITTAGQLTINQAMLAATPIPLPSVEEQRRAVEGLRTIQAKLDAVQSLHAETAAELDAIFPSVLDKAFKGEL